MKNTRLIFILILFLLIASAILLLWQGGYLSSLPQLPSASISEPNENAPITPEGDIHTYPYGLPLIYSNTASGYTIHYAPGFTLDETYSYTNLGPGKSIKGVAFTIPPELAQGTNLSPDSYISVEQIPTAKTCMADLFLDSPKVPAQQFVDNGVPLWNTVDEITYSKNSVSGAAAGNRYEETVFALPNSKPCLAVRYFVHMTVIENYPAGTVKPYDQDSLELLFWRIRRSLVQQ